MWNISDYLLNLYGQQKFLFSCLILRALVSRNFPLLCSLKYAVHAVELASHFLIIDSLREQLERELDMFQDGRMDAKREQKYI
jgi:hypothetical protein